MENKFEKPVMEVITFEAEDIITTSCNDDHHCYIEGCLSVD